MRRCNVGRTSNRSKPKKVRAKVIRLIREKYSGEVGERFGPTLAAEHLESEDKIQLSPTTVRRWMLEEHLWSRERKARKHRKRRDRREHFGDLVQLDGSFHEWLEKPTLCRMGKEETIWAAVGALRAWMEKYGGVRNRRKGTFLKTVDNPTADHVAAK